MERTNDSRISQEFIDLIDPANALAQLEGINTILRWFMQPNETVVEAVQRLYDEFVNRPGVSA